MARNVASNVGLDIGTSSVKTVELIRSGTSYKLRRASIQPLADAAPETVAQALKSTAETVVGARHLRISVAGSSLLIRRIEMPQMNAAELRNAVKFEAENHIPFPVDECMLDHHVVQAGAEGKNATLLLVALKKEFIQERVKMLHDLGLKPELVDVDAFALVNAFERLGPEARPKNYGLLNIGHGTSLFTIVQSGQPFFVREINTGGLEVTRALAETLSLDEAAAEKVKLSADPARAADLKAAALRALSPLVNELKSSVDYFENESGEELKQVWVCGGSAAGWAEEVLTQEVGRTFKVWDPLLHLEVLSEASEAVEGRGPAFAVALGLAVREMVAPQ
ncbi:MAG: hypothetical protein MOGMAGMI_01299 [Candidatus Omnitrophica bacterium]|nr:hypothetical protein [Candidatus Omnitrophota bacterium]